MAEDLAVAERDLALGERGHLGIVSDHDDGVALAMQVLQQFGDDLLVGGVEVAGGLVGEEDGWVVDEGAGDADALLFAAGELAGQVGEARSPRPTRSSAARASVSSVIEWKYCASITFSRAERYGIRWNCWKMKPILSARKRSSSVARHGGDVDVVDLELPAVGRSRQPMRLTSVDLAGAGGAGDGDPLAGDDGEGGVVERAHWRWRGRRTRG